MTSPWLLSPGQPLLIVVVQELFGTYLTLVALGPLERPGSLAGGWVRLVQLAGRGTPSACSSHSRPSQRPGRRNGTGAAQPLGVILGTLHEGRGRACVD